MIIDFSAGKLGHFVIIPTFKCNVMCSHCQHYCGPQNGRTMPFDLFKRVISEAIDFGFQTICLSGGEPFLLRSYIQEAAELCETKGKKLVIQTNGFWGGKSDGINKLLSQMAGFTQIGFSLDICHLQQIPIETVLRAIDLTLSCSIRNISISVSYQSEDEFNSIKEVFEKKYSGILITGWPILPIGRASENPHLYRQSPSFSWSFLQRCCPVQLKFSPIVHPSGMFHACYHIIMVLEGLDPLILGDLNTDSLETILGSISNSTLAFLLGFGGGGLGYLLKGSPFEYLLEKKYTSVCHFCYTVFSKPPIAEYIRILLARPGLKPRIAKGLELFFNRVPRKNTDIIERILVCNGENCSKHQKNYPLIHYLINRLTDQKKINKVDIKKTSCFNLCSTSPNFYFESKRRFIRSVTKEVIDELVDNI